MLTNEGIYSLKEALIANKIIATLILQKVKLTDECILYQEPKNKCLIMLTIKTNLGVSRVSS